MRHDFSSAYLMIKPPATSFGEAWELLCMDLLVAEHGSEALLRPGPPDHGIDIYNKPTQHAYQWDSLCSKYGDIVRDRFYYRVTADEKAVLDAFRSAGYYKQYVMEFAEKIRRNKFSLLITNNRTPFFPNKELANKLVIVSHNKIDTNNINYLKMLREKFSLPVFYQQFDTESNVLIKTEY